MSMPTAPNTAPIRLVRIPDTETITLADGRRLVLQPIAAQYDVGAGVIQLQLLFRGPKNLGVIASIEPTPHGDLLHVSISYPGHHPSWKDIRLIKDAFFGTDIDAMMVLPSEADYVNRHEHCFHIWQTPTTWGLQ